MDSNVTRRSSVRYFARGIFCAGIKLSLLYGESTIVLLLAPIYLHIYLGGTDSLILQNRHILSIHRQLIPASLRRHEYPITAVVPSTLSSSLLSVNRSIGIPVAIPSRRCHSPDSNSSYGQISQRSFDIPLLCPLFSAIQADLSAS